MVKFFLEATLCKSKMPTDRGTSVELDNVACLKVCYSEGGLSDSKSVQVKDAQRGASVANG